MNFSFTTAIPEQRAPIQIRGYTHKGFFRQYCPECRYYHAYALGNAIRITQCLQQRGLIELVSLGEAEGEIADCIEAGEALPWHTRRDTARADKAAA